jgi:hypothetical protein
MTSSNKLFPHEFLYLMVNSVDRCELMKSLPQAKFSIKKVDLAYNYEELKKHDGRKIDKVYELEDKTRENPRVKLAAYLKGPFYKDKTVQLYGYGRKSN